ncbi:MAG: uroporphyrinogen decarboxylase family protein [Deltaproteobacteria bacterium]|nr:uroporphyrinogen decarboxylase family protein [Deltaproteobacteria bacterium]
MPYSATARFTDAFRGTPKDRVPVVPMIAGWAAANFSDTPLPELARDPEGIARAQVRAMEAVGHDAFFSYADPLYVPEAFGCRVRYARTGPIVDQLAFKLESMEDLEEFPAPDPKGTGRLPMVLELVGRLNSYGNGEILVLGAFEGAFTSATRIIEADQVMRMVIKRPHVLHGLLDRINDFLIGFGHALIESGANALFIPEPSASASMISRDMFRRFVLPRLQVLVNKFEVPCILHMCGDTSPMLREMKDTGFHVLSLDQCMDLEKSRDLARGVAIGGNVDPVNSLFLGTRDQVREDTLGSLRKAGTAQFVLMSGCGVPPGAPVENLKVMVETAKEFGLG